MQRTISGRLEVRSDSYVPNDVERAQLQDIVKGDEGRLVVQKEKIAALQLELEQLREEQDVLEANIGHCRSALSTRRRLPVELWGIIFGHVCSEKRDGCRYSLVINHTLEKTLFMPALVLSQVCAHWRNMVTSIPRLWSSMHVDLATPFDIQLPIAIYLANSKDCSLMLSIVLHTSTPSICGATAWGTLSSHLYRCVHLSMYGWDELPATQDLTFPILEYVSLDESFTSNHDNIACSWVSQALQRATKLTKVSLWTPCSPIPYSQLTSLEVLFLDTPGFGLEKLLHFLSTCQRLETLIVEDICVRWHGELGARTSDVKLPFLRKLALMEDSQLDPNPAVRALLVSLIMPSLVELRLSDFRWPDPNLLSIISQRSPRIERLLMDGFGAHKETLVPAKSDSSAPLISFLRRLSYLKDLKVIITEYPNPSNHPDEDLTTHAASAFSILLSELQVSTSESSDKLFLPRLESIYLNFSDITLDSETARRALAIAASRALVSPLKEFTLLRSNGKEPLDVFEAGVDLRQGIKELSIKGVRVHVREVRY